MGHWACGYIHAKQLTAPSAGFRRIYLESLLDRVATRYLLAPSTMQLPDYWWSESLKVENASHVLIRVPAEIGPLTQDSHFQPHLSAYLWPPSRRHLENACIDEPDRAKRLVSEQVSLRQLMDQSFIRILPFQRQDGVVRCWLVPWRVLPDLPPPE